MKTFVALFFASTFSIFSFFNLLSNETSKKIIASCTSENRPNDSLASFFTNLISTNYWPARWDCGTWSNAEGWTYIISDLSISIAYFSIPILLFVFSRRVTLNKSQKLILYLFCAFILLCGATHLIDSIIFWNPIYRISLLSKLLTGVVSIGTAVVVGFVFPRALEYKSPEAVEKEISEEVKLREELKQVNQELEAFTFSVSHDLRAPLRVIKEFAKEVNRQNEERSTISAELLDRIMKNSMKMELMIDELLAYSRVSKQLLKLDEVNTYEAVNRIIEENFPESEAIVCIDPLLPTLKGDERLIELLFSNLISNAIKYSSKVDNPQITILFSEDEDFITYKVVDNGIGIDEIHKDRIFGVFERLHKEKDYKGTGVGLALCKRIMRRHQGNIWFESEIGAGATFFVRFRKNLIALDT